MHVYIGVDCKQCQKSIIFREIERGTEIDQGIGDHRLKCRDGHQNTYAFGDFYTLESNTPYAPSRSNRGHGFAGRELLVIALSLALILSLVWWYH